jgi:heterodisulfide reductase subunit C
MTNITNVSDPVYYSLIPENNALFIQEVTERSGQNLTACYQCKKCAAGCPVSNENQSITPDKLIRMVVLGDRKAALDNDLVWKCVSCYTCGTRCPNQIQTAKITETLKKMAKQVHVKPSQPKIAFFHDSFIKGCKHFGRVNEMEFMGMYELKNVLNLIKQKNYQAVYDELKQQALFAFDMLKRHRLHFSLQKTTAKKDIKRLFKKAKKQKKGVKWI